MAFINDIVINITRGTAALRQQEFNPLFMGSGAIASGVVVATELTDLVDAGYLTTDPEYLMASAAFAQTPRPETIKVIRKVDAETYTAALATYKTTDNAWWAICIDSRGKADLNEAGTFANANKKYFFGGSDDITALDNRNIDREAYIIHDNLDTDYPECALVGQNIPKTPGSFTYKWKRLSGQNASTFTSTQLTAIRTNNGIALQEQSGQTFTNEGISTSGEFIDVIHGQDWVEDQLKIEILGLMLNNDKISLDDTGIAQVEAKVRGVMKRAGDNGIIAEAKNEADLEKSDDKKYMYQVTTPIRADLSTADKTARILRDVKFVYFLAGAIHKVFVAGLITV